MGRPLASIAPTRRRLGWTRLRAAGAPRDQAETLRPPGAEAVEPGASPEAEGSRQRPRLRRPAASPDLQGPQEPEAPRAPAAQQSPAVLPVRAPPLLQGVLAARVAPAAVAARPARAAPTRPPKNRQRYGEHLAVRRMIANRRLACISRVILPESPRAAAHAERGLATARATLTVFAMAVPQLVP